MSKDKHYTLLVEQNAEGDKLAFFHPEGDGGNVSYRIAGPKAWGGSKPIAKLRISHYDLVVAIKEFAPSVHAELLQEQSSELAALREKCAELEKDVQVAKGQHEGACVIIKQFEEKCAELELKLLNCEDESKSGFYRGLSEELQAKLDEAAKQEPFEQRHPTLRECEAAGVGPKQLAGMFSEGGLPNSTEERARFEAYMKGHCWDFGGYDTTKQCYDTVQARMLYGVWRDRGSLPSIASPIQFPNLSAIIEQAKAEEREACAKICEAMNPFVVINGERWNKNGDGALFRLLDVAPNLERMHMNKLAFEGRSVEDEHNEHPVQKCAAAIRARKP